MMAPNDHVIYRWLGPRDTRGRGLEKASFIKPEISHLSSTTLEVGLDWIGEQRGRQSTDPESTSPSRAAFQHEKKEEPFR